VFVTLWHRRQVTEMRLKAMLDLAERGRDVPFELLAVRPTKPGIVDLRLGMVLASIGIGALLFAFTLQEHPVWGLGLLPLFAGIGFLLTWRIGRSSETNGTHG
jgi:hypothetical protein